MLSVYEHTYYDTETNLVPFAVMSPPLQGWETYCFSPGIRLSVCPSVCLSAETDVYLCFKSWTLNIDFNEIYSVDTQVD